LTLIIMPGAPALRRLGTGQISDHDRIVPGWPQATCRRALRQNEAESVNFNAFSME
jgi:hypothetical protein